MGRGNEKMIRAVANEHRRRILEILYNRRSCRYSELLKLAGFGVGESGRFAYHLKKLLDYGLVKQLPNGEYTLTTQGKSIVRILREEVDDEPTIIDVLEGFSRKMNTDRFIVGNILLACGEVFTIIGAVLAVQGFLKIPAKLEFFGTIREFYIDPLRGLLLAAMGVIVLAISLRILRGVLPSKSILELLIYQRYALLFASRSTRLKRYLGYYVLAIVVTVAVIIGVVLL